MSNEINSYGKSTNLSFLDVIVNQKNTRILTDMYYKLIDTHTNLRLESVRENHRFLIISSNVSTSF